MIKLSVSASKNYNVIMEAGILQNAWSHIQEALCIHGERPTDTKVCIVTDETVDKLYGQPSQALWKSLASGGLQVHKYTFAGGESTKTMSTITGILNYLADNNFTRSDFLIALGGGITGDITGFAAASFLRGIDFIQIPTSLLAVVDSSVGGKTGVNLDAGKNLAGAFWQPELVLFDPNVLKTLSYDLKLDGIAEAIKAGIIDDKNIFDLMIKNDDISCNEFLTELAALAVDVKRRVVEEDERENGIRQLLNLGHTPAHAIEKCSNYTIRHGHAVAIGMALVTSAATSYGWTDEATKLAIISALKKFGFSLDCPYCAEELAAAALSDKKRRGNTITLVIPDRIGKCSLRKINVSELTNFFLCGLKGISNI